MAIDTAQKRKSAAVVGMVFMIPGVTPFALQDEEWRQEAAWGYSGILVNVPIITEDEMSQGVKFHREMFEVKPLESYLAEIAAGRVTNADSHVVEGYNPAVGDSLTDISELGVSVIPLPSSAITMEVVSSSVNDTSGGTGAKTVEIRGLDANWDEISESVALNGTTVVALLNSYLRINKFQVKTAGSIGVADGTIKLQATGAGIEYDRITAGGNADLQAHYSVPNNYSVFINSINAGVTTLDKNTAGRIMLRATVKWHDRSLAAVYHFDKILVSQEGSRPIPVGLWYPEKCDIKISAQRIVGAAGIFAAGSFNIYKFLDDENSQSGTE